MQKDGPGFIDEFARFCSDEPEIEDRPNMFNTVMTISDAMSGRAISARQVDAAAKGLEDPNWDILKS